MNDERKTITAIVSRLQVDQERLPLGLSKHFGRPVAIGTSQGFVTGVVAQPVELPL